MSDSDLAIEVRDLVKRFGSFTAVDHISFSVRRGEIFGFLGPNGSGKTTTMRMACGLLTPTSGGGRVAGFDILRDAESIKQRIGYMSQRFSLYPDLSVDENLEFYAGVYGLSQQAFRQRRDQVLAQVGLESVDVRLTAHLSVGHRQRLALACAILHDPVVLFLDEPTSGVDPVSRRRFWDLIDGLAARGMTVLVTTHVMDESEFCGRLLLIDRGRRIALGTPSELRSSYGRVIVEIAAEPFMAALEFMQARPEVEEAAIFGARIHAAMSPSHASAEEWRQTLSAAGLTVTAVQQAEPSMEDVFVSLVAACEREREETSP